MKLQKPVIDEDTTGGAAAPTAAGWLLPAQCVSGKSAKIHILSKTRVSHRCRKMENTQLEGALRLSLSPHLHPERVRRLALELCVCVSFNKDILSLIYVLPVHQDMAVVFYVFFSSIKDRIEYKRVTSHVRPAPQMACTCLFHILSDPRPSSPRNLISSPVVGLISRLRHFFISTGSQLNAVFSP